MKKLHLVCNAHLDPVWLWQWKEGAAEAISTFRVAVEFCEQYDGFVFNHNESVLYEWVEEYDPELFRRIQKLVAAGRWKIIGGWYLQPDCNMLSGESFLAQIELGRKYFSEKFGCVPETAVNLDPFGHTKGLVQILQKTGYRNYLFMRPFGYPRNFVWEGFAGSSVLAHSIFESYNNLKGKALEKVRRCLEKCKEDETMLLAWGIGDHGGGPSRVDLEKLGCEIAENRETEIVHSTPDAYFDELDREKLPHVTTSLEHVMVGCYTSMVRIKKMHRELENRIAVMKKMAVFASEDGSMAYPEAEITEIQKQLAFCQFHDILPGSCIRPAEEDSIRMFAHALTQCDQVIAKAFFLLAKGKRCAEEGEIPILVYNPHPYKVRGTWKVGFMLQDQNWNEDETTIAEVFDECGNRVACQNEKPEATFNLDWVKSVAFAGELEPCSMNAFYCRLKTVRRTERTHEYGDQIVVEGAHSSLSINRKTGWIESYCVDGKEKIHNSGVLEVYRDNEDPWGMWIDAFPDKKGEFTLLDEEATGKFLGYDEPAQNVIISEDGEVRTKIDAFFRYENSTAVVEYILDKLSDDLDIRLTVYSAQANVCVKYRVDTTVENGEFVGQTAFGAQPLPSDGKEATYQKWCCVRNGDDALYVINDSMYGGSFRESSMYLTLLRTPIYSAHPIPRRQIAPHDRFIPHMDMGERSFSLKITTSPDYEKKALVFNEAPVTLSYFPQAVDTPCDREAGIAADNDFVQLSGFKREGDRVIFHLFNTAEAPQTVSLTGKLLAAKTTVTLQAYELQFVQIQNGVLSALPQGEF